MIQIRCCEKRPAPLNSAWNNLLRPETVPAKLTTTDQHQCPRIRFVTSAVLSRRRGTLSLLHPPSVSEDLSPYFWRYCYGYTSLVPETAYCYRGGVPALSTPRHGCGRPHPNQAADEGIPPHRQNRCCQKGE